MLKKRKSKNFGKYFYIILFVVLFDQLTKNLMKNKSFSLIENFLGLTFTTNTGSLFGILKGANLYLIFFSLIVLGAFMFYWDKIKKNEKIFFALITGGIIGNFIDRVAYGYVIDFINFNFWPAFNVADSCLTIGIIGLIIYEFRK